jgi:myo-inositol-1(or 4)-monophosphatase
MRMRGRAAVSEKGHANPVTEADIASQAAITTVIAGRHPGHGMVAEEHDLRSATDSEYVWYVDPMDGTANYARDLPHFCVSIGCARNGAPVAAVVLDPNRAETFTATLGGGAYLNGKRLGVRACPRLRDAITTTGFYYDRGEIIARTLAALQRLFDAGLGDMRRTGSAALDLCWLAAGRIDAYFEYDLGPWDKAAGALVAAEAGAVVRNRDATPFAIGGRGILASGPSIAEQFAELAAFRG